MQVYNMAEICQRVHHDHLIFVFVWLILLRPIHVATENQGLARFCLFKELVQIALREEKTRFNQHQQFQGFPPTLSDSNLNGLSYLFHEVARSQYCFTFISMERMGTTCLWNYKSHDTNHKILVHPHF